MISAWHQSSSIGRQLNFSLVMCINEMLMLRLCHNKAAPSVPSVAPIRAETQQLQHPSNGSGQSQENCCLSVVLADRHASFQVSDSVKRSYFLKDFSRSSKWEFNFTYLMEKQPADLPKKINLSVSPRVRHQQ